MSSSTHTQAAWTWNKERNKENVVMVIGFVCWLSAWRQEKKKKKGVREISVCLTLFGSASHLCTPSKRYVNNQGFPPLFSCYLSGKGVESHNSSPVRPSVRPVGEYPVRMRPAGIEKRKRHIHFSHCNGFFNVGADRPLERSVTWTQKPLDHASWDFRRRRLLPYWLLAGVSSERKPFQFHFASFDTKFIKKQNQKKRKKKKVCEKGRL
jgi:hypothetical protein